MVNDFMWRNILGVSISPQAATLATASLLAAYIALEASKVKDTLPIHPKRRIAIPDNTPKTPKFPDNLIPGGKYPNNLVKLIIIVTGSGVILMNVEKAVNPNVDINGPIPKGLNNDLTTELPLQKESIYCPTSSDTITSQQYYNYLVYYTNSSSIGLSNNPTPPSNNQVPIDTKPTNYYNPDYHMYLYNL